jgi:hypothetical protein
LNHQRPGRQHLLASKLALQGPLCDRRDQFQIERHGFADALYLLQQRQRCTEDGSERAEALEQRFGDRLGVAPGDQPEQQQFEQLVVGEGCIAMLTEAVAQALAVVLFLVKRGGEAGLLRQGCRLGGLFREKGPFVIKRSSIQGREAGSVEAAWRKRENLAAVGSNPDRVFVLRRKRAIARYRSPAVRQNLHMRPTEIDHRLDREDHAFPQFGAFVRATIV